MPRSMRSSTRPSAARRSRAGSQRRGAWRYEPGEVLGARGMLEWSIVDPGSVNLTAFADIAADKVGYVYMNVESDIRAGFAAAEKHGYHASMALYEPGFVRLPRSRPAIPGLKDSRLPFPFLRGLQLGLSAARIRGGGLCEAARRVHARRALDDVGP